MLLSLGLMTVATQALAVQITWTDWTSATPGLPGSAAGSLSPWDGPVGVTYTGDVSFAQLGSGTNYWTEGTPPPYTGNSYVDNAPTPAEMIAQNTGGVTNTITFSRAVLNPVMAIVSQGRLNLPVTYDFDQSFTVLSEGRGYWGDGYYTLGSGDALTGYELHGVIQFHGAVTSVSWVASPAEYWHGFTMGISQVPEPSSLLLLGALVAGYGVMRRRKRV